MSQRGIDKMTNEQYLGLKDDLRNWMEEGFKNIQNQITTLIGKDITRIDSELSRSSKQHDEHYQFERAITKDLNTVEKRLEDQITESRISTIREISSTNKEQDYETKSALLAHSEAIKTLQTNQNLNTGKEEGKRSNAALIASLIAVSGTVIGIILNLTGG